MWLKGNANANISLKTSTNILTHAGRVCFDAAGFGYVKRDRCFWGTSDHCAINQITWTLPPGFDLAKEKQPPGEERVVYSGTKPLPKNVFIEDGFQLSFDPRDVVKDPKKAMDPFVREHSRPWDTAYEKSSAGAQARYKEDSLRFPPKSYESHNLVGKGDGHRVPHHRERLAMHGFPANIPDDLPELGKSKERS